MDQVHAVSLKTDTIEEFKNIYKHEAEEILCRGGSKYEKKIKEQQTAKDSKVATSDSKTDNQMAK